MIENNKKIMQIKQAGLQFPDLSDQVGGWGYYSTYKNIKNKEGDRADDCVLISTVTPNQDPCAVYREDMQPLRHGVTPGYVTNDI